MIANVVSKNIPGQARPLQATTHRSRRGWLCLWLLLGLPSAWALKPTDQFGLKELEDDPAMTPANFADLFGEFAYDYYPNVQPPDIFLHNRAGDCDDYAILADYILGRRGFQTRLIRVQLVGSQINHVVCYVTEKRAYLDYNNRKYFFNLERSDPSIREIAGKVADSFEKNWTTATEYTYSYGQPRQHALRTIVKTDPPERDPDRQRAPLSR